MAVWYLIYILVMVIHSMTETYAGYFKVSSFPTFCEAGFAVGLRCKGVYCDSVAVKCSENVDVGESWWTSFTSAQNKELYCPQHSFVSGITCRGYFCQDIALRCSEADEYKSGGECYWLPPISPENRTSAMILGYGQFIQGLRCSGHFCSRKSAFICHNDQMDRDKELAVKFAPILRFDRAQGKPNKCFPSDAGHYYEQRKKGYKERICQTNYRDLHNGRTPTYYQVQKCGKNAKVIQYWWFYGFQDYCFLVFGSHNADWERVAVKVVNGSIERVLFHQHSGHYTKKAGNFKRKGNHPIVYAGRNSHGNYHDGGGTGSCLYFEDYRYPGVKDQQLHSWKYLIRLSDDPGAPEWMRPSIGGCGRYFDGKTPPTCRKDDVCKTPGCDGDALMIGILCLGQCGCHKSNVKKQELF